MSKVSFLQIAGAKPFSAFQRTPRRRGKTTVKRTGRRKNVRTNRRTGRKTNKKSLRKTKRRTKRQTKRRTKRQTKRRTSRGPVKGKCNYTGNEPSPKGLGYCARHTPLKVTMKGKDGNLWENQKYSKGKRWVKVRNDMVGGFIRGLY